MSLVATLAAPSRTEESSHPRRIGWIGTWALAMGGSNQSLFLISALFAGQNGVPGQGSAAVPLLAFGLLLSWAAAPGWTELILTRTDRVGGIAAACTDAFRPYSPILSALAGCCYWWGWVPTCGLTAILTASAITSWYLPSLPVEPVAILLVTLALLINLQGIKFATRIAIPVATISAVLAFISGVAPIFAGHVDWRLATDFHLVVPFSGWFGSLTSVMAGLYLIGFAAPAFEAAACHVGETIDPERAVPGAMLASAATASVYFVLLPVVWLGVLGPGVLGGDLALGLGPTFAPLFGAGAKAAAIGFMAFNMFHGTLQPLAGAARTLSQLADDGVLPRVLGRRSRHDVPWVATSATAVSAILLLLSGDPVQVIAAANFTYLIGICLPNIAVWLLRRNEPELPRPYRAPRGAIGCGLAAAGIWGLSAVLGFEQFGLPTVILGLVMAYSGALLYAWRRIEERRRRRETAPQSSLHLKLTGAMVAVLALDGAGYFLAVRNIPAQDGALVTALEDIFVMVALLTISVGLVLPGVIAQAALQVRDAARRLATVTMAEFTEAMEALGRGDLDAADAAVSVVPVRINSRDEVGQMAADFNLLQVEIERAVIGLRSARDGLREARTVIQATNDALQQRVEERNLLIDALMAARVDQAAAEEAVRQAQKVELLGQLTGGIAHDFNNVLASVMGGLEMLDRGSRSERDRRVLAGAIRAAERGAKLTEQLLAFARRQRLRPKPIYIASLVEEVEELLSRTLGGLIRFEVDIQRPLWRALADPTQMEMIILNLAINARDAIGNAGGTVRIVVANQSAESPDLPAGAGQDCVLLAVSDTGSGMSEEVRRRAFEPFFTTKPPGKGSGLGLSQVHGVVTQLGGAVTIDSTEGVGTTVRIFLPRTDLAEEAQDVGWVAIQSAAARRAGRILLVDDDPEVRELTMTYLVDLGYDVLEASDGEGGLELIQDNPDIDAMLADFAMPGMNGAMLVGEARKIRPDLLVLMLTGYAADAAEEISAAGVTIVSKPYKLADLASAVGQLLGSVHRPHSALP